MLQILNVLFMSNCEQCIVRELGSLKALEKQELIHLAACKEAYLVKKGEVIFEEGERMKGVYCVKDGVCKLVKLNADGKESILRLVKKGELLGQRSVISEETSFLSAVAIEDMQVCFIPRTEIMKFIKDNANFSLEITKDICSQLKEANSISVDFSHKTVKERLARVLIHLLELSGEDEQQNINIQISREELANMAGTATESCIRLLSEMKKEGLIALDKKKIKILNFSALKKMTQ